MGFGWGIIGLDRPVNLSGHPPFTAQKNAKLECLWKILFYQQLSTPRKHGRDCALQQVASPTAQQLHSDWPGGATDGRRPAS